MPIQRRKGRNQIGSKADRAKFQRRNIHVFQGINEDGVGVYKTYYDNFLANEAALEKLRGDQLDIATEIDLEDRAAHGRANREKRHSVPGHWMDDEQLEQHDDE